MSTPSAYPENLLTVRKLQNLPVSLEVCDFEKTELEPSLLGAIYTERRTLQIFWLVNQHRNSC